MNSAQPTLADAMMQAHGVLMKDLKELGKLIRGASPPAPGLLKVRLLALQQHVSEHFRFEEENGYMSEVLKRKPHLNREVANLRTDHRLLTESLDQLITEAESRAGPDEQWRQRLDAWLAEIHRHEIRENDLIQDAFNLDISAED